MKKIVFCMLAVVGVAHGSSFEREIKEVQVYEDRIRINIGITYGSCGAKDVWWGWHTTNISSASWLSVVLTAQAQGKAVTVYDAQDSCAGPVDAIGLEGIFLK